MTMTAYAQPITMGALEILGMITPEYETILTPEAIAFIEDLERRLGNRRRKLLKLGEKRQKPFDSGKLPDFWPQPGKFRESKGPGPPTRADVEARRVKMPGRVDRKMVKN